MEILGCAPLNDAVGFRHECLVRSDFPVRVEEMVARFYFDWRINEDGRTRLIAIMRLASLMNFANGMIINLTASCPWGQRKMPPLLHLKKAIP